jgi:hypothetical protein
MASSADLGGSGLANLGSWTIAQLRDLAQRIGLGGYSRMDKTGLLDAVSQALPKAQSSAVLTAEHTPEANFPAAVLTPIASELTSHITFLPRDPQWAYVFWEISAGDQQRAAAAGATQLALRVADVTDTKRA